MTFQDIYNRIIPHWGDKIEFDDGKIISNIYSATPGFLSEKLSNKWNKIEETVGNEDKFGELMVWTIFQIIHKHAKINFLNGNYSIKTEDLNQEEIEEQYFENLKGEGWEEELKNYKREKNVP